MWRQAIKLSIPGLSQKQSLGIIATLLFVVLIVVVMTSTRERIPDFRIYAAGEERKTAFFEYLKPIVEASNDDIREMRQQLLTLEPSELSAREERWLQNLASRYDVDHETLPIDEQIDILRRRVDVVPKALGLAQAAKESGWGTSRFAREGNNLFGEWCFDEGCGIVPLNRAPGRSHEVRDFASPKGSIDSYLLNLNSHPAYREFRSLRQQLREDDQPLSGRVLAGGLSEYSERGDVYVKEVRSLIRSNELE